MKARYAYPLLFLLPGAMVAFLAAFVVAGAGAGVLWLFVLGDGAWPASAGTAVLAVATATFSAVLITLAVASYIVGRNREASGGLSWSHIAIAVVTSVLLPLLVVVQQWQVGNVGDRPAPASRSSDTTPIRGAP